MSIFLKTSSVPSGRRKLRDSGAMLLAILLLMAMMVIAATYEAPRMVQQLKRDREEEMIHRGTEYARAIKKYYKKSGQYPTTIEQLESTNNIRFLRKRYKDPLSQDGKWTLLHYNDVAASLVGAGGPGVSAASLGSGAGQQLGSPAGQTNSSPFGSSFGSSNASGSSNFGSSSSGFGSANAQSVNQNGIFSQSGTAGTTGQQAVGGSSTNDSPPGQSSSPSTSSIGSNAGTLGGTASSSSTGPNGGTSVLGNTQSVGGQNFGAGAIMGVASKSKDPTIRVYNKKKTYEEWQFIYNPVMDQANVLLKGPYSPSTLTTSNVGTPAGQLNQQNQNQQQSPFGQPNSGFGSQQPVSPGGQQTPQDQSH